MPQEALAMVSDLVDFFFATYRNCVRSHDEQAFSFRPLLFSTLPEAAKSLVQEDTPSGNGCHEPNV
jgi:hypothetical protein